MFVLGEIKWHQANGPKEGNDGKDGIRDGSEHNGNILVLAQV